MAAATKQFEARGIQRILNFPVASGSTFLAGDFVILNASGAVAQGAASGSNIGAVSGITNMVAGRAVENAVNDQGALKSRVGVMICESGTEFKLGLWHSTAASAVANATLLTQKFELKNTSSPAMGYAIDLTATTNTKVKIVDFEEETYVTALGTYPDVTGASTTQYGNAWVTFIPSVTVAGAA